MWQIDAEYWNGTGIVTPTIAEINAIGDAVCARTGCPASSVIAYAPTWVYGTKLTGLRYRVWASNYGGNPAGPYRSIYPGDTSDRWHAPVDPLFLQYGSAATIAGQTTCDANAYRGTLSQLVKELNGGKVMTLAQTDINAIAAAVFNLVWHGDVDSGGRKMSAGTALLALFDRPAPVVDVAAVAAAARDGAQAGVVAAAAELAQAVVDRLPTGVITRQDVDAAVRDVLGAALRAGFEATAPVPGV
jgi:hypothetical protein